MKVENLETAERFSKKRRTLADVGKLLESYVNSAEVIVRVNFGDKVKEASIKSDTFNALMYKLVESEIKNIDDFVEQL